MSELLVGSELDPVTQDDIAELAECGEEGVTTAEYAMGVVLVITFIVIVISALRGGWLGNLVEALVKLIFGVISKQLTGF